MRTLRVMYRLFRLFSMVYAVWRGSRVTRAVTLASWIWRILRREPKTTTRPRIMISLDPNSSALFRRRGWRQISRKSDS